MRQKSPPSKMCQNSSASKISASKIIKNRNASKFCASEITPRVSASYATLRQNSMSQNSRVKVPCVKRSVRHRPFSRFILLDLNLQILFFLHQFSPIFFELHVFCSCFLNSLVPIGNCALQFVNFLFCISEKRVETYENVCLT